MSSPFGDRPFPRSVLFAVAAMLGFVLLAVAVVRLTAGLPSSQPESAAVETRSLRFADRADGAVLVYNAADDSVVKVLDPATNAFVRGVLRGLARERRANSVGKEPPFDLTRWADGRLTLQDPTTGRMIDLNAFGHTNLAAFTQLLESNDRSASGTASVVDPAATPENRHPQQGVNGHDG